MIYQPKIFTSFEGVVAVESQRSGGQSQFPYSSLNLGLYTKDSKDDVSTNRSRFFEALGFDSCQVAGTYQIHSDVIKIVTTPGEFQGYDALVTNQKDILLTVTVADCTPVLIYDTKKSVVAAIHAGWKGTKAKLVSKTLVAMQDNFETIPSDCIAYVGSCIDANAFETDADVADCFLPKYKRWDAEKKKYFVDLKQTNKDLLLDSGVLPQHIEVSPFCTYGDNDKYFSYRKEKGVTGRMLAAIAMKN